MIFSYRYDCMQYRLSHFAVIAVQSIVAVTFLLLLQQSNHAACNAPEDPSFTGVINVSPSPQNVTVPNFYTPNLEVLSNAALGWFNFGNVEAVDKSIITSRYLVCCPQAIAEPGYGVWEVVFHHISGSATLSPSFGTGVVLSIIEHIVGAASGAGVDSPIVSQLQNALSALSVTFAGVDASWSGIFYDPETARDDCHGCAYNTRWAGSEDYSIVGTVGAYNNTSWVGGTVFAISVTLLDADVNIHYSSVLVAGHAYKLRTTSSSITTSYQFGLGPQQTQTWVNDSPTTTTISDSPFCSASSPPSP